MTSRTILTALGGLLLAAGLVAGEPLAQSKTIKIGFLGSEADEDYDGALVFEDFVESRTNGEIAVEIYPNGTFCSKVMECIEQVQSGELEVTVSTIGGFGNIFPPGQVLDLPYMFRDDRVAECVFDGPFTRELRRAVLDEIASMRLMTIANTGGWRNFATVGKQIRTPEDIRGMKIQTIPTEIQVELVKMLGGSPAPVSWPEVYASLATGALEGTKSGVTDITSMKFEEHIDHITLDGHTYVAALWWMNNDFFMGLAPEQRKIVHDGFQHLKTVTRALPMRRAIDAYEVFRQAGGEVYVPGPEEKQAFRDATAGMKDWFKNQHGDTWLIKLEKAIADCEDEIEAEYAEFIQE